MLLTRQSVNPGMDGPLPRVLPIFLAAAKIRASRPDFDAERMPETDKKAAEDILIR